MRPSAFILVTRTRHGSEIMTRYENEMLDLPLVAGTALLCIHIVSLALAWRKCRARNKDSPLKPMVSLVRPVCGLEPHIEDNLRSSFTQDYPKYEVIFCAACPNDAAVVLVQDMMNAYPHIPARLLVGEQRLSQNPKLNNMAKAWLDSKGQLVVFSESNLLLTKHYCPSVAAAFAANETMVVSSPPIGDFAENFFGEVECAMLNTHAARWQFAASQLEINFAQGKTLAFRRSAFDGGLMERLAAEPAEDAAATKLVRSMGGALNVLAPPFTHPVGARSLRSFWSRHVRWARLRRVTFPTVFSLEIGCGMFPAILAFAMSSTLSSIPLPLTIIVASVLWYGAEYAFARSLGWRCNRWFVLACLVRDAFLPAFYVAAWVSARFEWRGHAMDSTAKGISNIKGHCG